ncbi:PDPFL protein, partial [Serilophus lunatus]|nr:PDPFL protein [Serilophus lunatus]
MASVPSAGCLLAKNQYYRSKCSGEPGTPCIPQTQPPSFFPFLRSDWEGLPELIDKYWWIKSFFHSEPSPPTVGRKKLSAS